MSDDKTISVTKCDHDWDLAAMGGGECMLRCLRCNALSHDPADLGEILQRVGFAPDGKGGFIRPPRKDT